MLTLFACPASALDAGGSTSTTTSGTGNDTPPAPLPLRSNAHAIGHPDDASHITGADVLYNAIVREMGLN